MSSRSGRSAPSSDHASSLLQSAVAHHRAGRLNEADALYREILAAAPKHFDAKRLRGVVALQTGRLDEAHALIAEAIALHPKFATAHNSQGEVYVRQGRLDEAQASFQRAVELQPGFADAHFNLANQLRRQGKLLESAAHFRRAIAADGKSMRAHNNLGVTLFDLGDLRGAVRAFATAVKLNHRYAEALTNLGIALARAGDLAQALDALDRAVKLDPKSATALSNRGSLLARLERHAEARECLEQVVALAPTSAAAHCNLGNMLGDSGESGAAVERFQRALELDPQLVEARVGLAVALRDLGRDDEACDAGRRLSDDYPQSVAAHMFDAAACWDRGNTQAAANALRKAIGLRASNAEAHYRLGTVLMKQLRSVEAIDCFQKALALDASHVSARWARTMAEIVPICKRPEDVAVSRARFSRMLSELDRWFDAAHSANGHMAVGSLQPYYLAYHAADNRELLSRYGALCTRLMAAWQRPRLPVASAHVATDRIRVGIASAQLREHSVWNAIVKGWVQHLDRGRFEIHLFNLSAFGDAETEQARRWAHRFEGGRRELPQWAATIGRSELDVLIYPEIGMDALTVKLASLRLARVQAATWGHPETTGLPSIDYYITAEGLEGSDATCHYAERMVALPNLGVCYEPLTPIVAAPDLAALGLPPDAPLLLCPGTPFKYQPQHDSVWVEIARRAAPVRLVFFRPSDPGVSQKLEERLQQRFDRAGLRYVDCVTFVPTLDRAHYFGLMQRAHLMLDTLGFSGFNTAIQAIECGLPVVSREGEFMRARFASGILRRMGMDALIATSDNAYVELAVALVREPARYALVRNEIVARRGVLFGDVEPVRALERFLESVARPATD